MFQAILMTQWKWSRVVLLPLGVLAFAVPILSVRGAGDAYGVPAAMILANVQTWGLAYPFLAMVLGLALSVAIWSPDRAGRHVYALSLPLPRWHYVLLRFGAGALLLAAPVLLLWIGALLATSTAALPPGLHAYPTALMARFALATVISFAVAFALLAGSSPVVRTLLSTLGLLVMLQVVISMIGFDLNLLGPLGTGLFEWPGPLEILTGRWMLIDV